MEFDLKVIVNTLEDVSREDVIIALNELLEQFNGGTATVKGD